MSVTINMILSAYTVNLARRSMSKTVFAVYLSLTTWSQTITMVIFVGTKTERHYQSLTYYTCMQGKGGIHFCMGWLRLSYEWSKE